MLFKYVENNENGFNNWGDCLPQPPREDVWNPEDGQIGNKWGSIQDPAAGQPIPSKNLTGPLGLPLNDPGRGTFHQDRA